MELILDYKKWSCGNGPFWQDKAPAKNRHGVGKTSLHNEKGYSCCIGQFMKQEGHTASFLKGKGAPYDCKLHEHPNKPRSTFTKKSFISLDNSTLAENAMKINDDENTTIAQKITQLWVPV